MGHRGPVGHQPKPCQYGEYHQRRRQLNDAQKEHQQCEHARRRHVQNEETHSQCQRLQNGHADHAVGYRSNRGDHELVNFLASGGVTERHEQPTHLLATRCRMGHHESGNQQRNEQQHQRQ